MRRITIVVFMAAAVVFAPNSFSAALETPLTTSTTVPKTIGTCQESQIGPRASDCDFGRTGTKPEAGQGVIYTSDSKLGGTAGSGSSGTSKKYVPYNRLSTGPDGQPCATTGYVEEGTVPGDERLLLDPNPLESKGPNYRDVLEDYPPCPERPRAQGELAPVETRAMVAARHWERVPLPEPQPSIAPGRAITGKLAYLETRGQIAHVYTNDTVFGPLTIVAAGSYTVAWGDGTTTGPHSFEGKRWPDGDITHTYVNVGSYNVNVTERWTATWSLDGESGTLRTLQTTGSINDFPVEQIQAVIGR